MHLPVVLDRAVFKNASNQLTFISRWTRHVNDLQKECYKVVSLEMFHGAWIAL